jgi:hypothetical protein
MAFGAQIVINPNPKGMFLEGVISGTPLPGTIVEMVPNVVQSNGRFTWRASTRAAGKDRMAAVLMEDSLQGFPFTTAYVSGTRCFMYVPISGEDVNVLVDVLGTGTSSHGGATIGEYLIFNNDGRLIIESGSPQNTAFVADEFIADTAVGYQLTWVTKL